MKMTHIKSPRVVLSLIRRKKSKVTPVSPTISPQITRQPWVLNLPNELLVQILYCAQLHGDGGGGDACLFLIAAFPELTRFTLVIVDSSIPHIMDELEYSYFGNMETVSIQEYATFDYTESRRRPMKLFLLDIDGLQLPSLLFDGSDDSLFRRFLDRNSIVYTSSGSGIRQLCRSIDVFEITIISEWVQVQGNKRLRQLDCGSLKTPRTFMQYQNRLFHDMQYSILSDQPGYSLNLIRPEPNDPWMILYQGAYRFRYIWLPYHLDDTNIHSLCVFNCTDNFSFRCPSSLRRLEIITAKTCPDIHISPNQCVLSVSMYNVFPSELLHVKFSGHLVPRIIGPRGFVQNNPKATLALENTNWAPATPYGLSVLSNSVGEQDQAIWNFQNPDWSTIRICYHVLHFVGIPDSILMRCSWGGVMSLTWRRLSPRLPVPYFEHSDVRATIRAGDLRDLVIESVFRKNESFLKFQTEALERLVLISLHDSDTAWNLSHLLLETPPCLEEVYLERRLNKGKASSLRIGITNEDLSIVSLAVKRLHLRGYVPLLVLSSTPSYSHRFSQLKVFMLDITYALSEPIAIAEPFEELRQISLTFREENFPVLQTLILMCTKESRMADAFSDVHIDVSLATGSIRLLKICSLINSPKIVVNGHLLEFPKGENKMKRVQIPVVESRRCFQWRLNWMPFSWKFNYDREVILDDYDYWLRDIREY